MAISHDRLFKELLRKFLWEFLELFIPGIIPHLERDDPPDFLEPEVFTDITAGKTHRADVVAPRDLPAGARGEPGTAG